MFPLHISERPEVTPGGGSGSQPQVLTLPAEVANSLRHRPSQAVQAFRASVTRDRPRRCSSPSDKAASSS